MKPSHLSLARYFILAHFCMQVDELCKIKGPLERSQCLWLLNWWLDSEILSSALLKTVVFCHLPCEIHNRVFLNRNAEALSAFSVQNLIRSELAFIIWRQVDYFEVLVGGTLFKLNLKPAWVLEQLNLTKLKLVLVWCVFVLSEVYDYCFCADTGL